MFNLSLKTKIFTKDILKFEQNTFKSSNGEIENTWNNHEDVQNKK